MVEVEEVLFRSHPDVVDADLSDYFGSIPHAELLKSVARRVVDRRVLHLIKQWLECPVEETDGRGRKRRTTVAKDSRCGIPQGSPISPLLANLYMRRFVLAWKKLGLEQSLGSQIVTYADDLVILCRRGKAEETEAAYRFHRVAAEVSEFIDDMAAAYAWADVAICRAGALTVSELMAAGLPAVLVPFPFAVDDHQTANARFLVDAGAALLLQQRDMTPGRLGEQLRLGDRVLSGVGVEHQQGLVGRPGHLAVGHPGHLGELGHEVRSGVEPTGGVDHQHIVPDRRGLGPGRAQELEGAGRLGVVDLEPGPGPDDQRHHEEKDACHVSRQGRPLHPPEGDEPHHREGDHAQDENIGSESPDPDRAEARHDHDLPIDQVGDQVLKRLPRCGRDNGLQGVANLLCLLVIQ